MRIIKSLLDIECLRLAQALPNDYLNQLAEEFNNTVEAYGGLAEWNPDLFGYLVVVEKGDNLRDLSVVGLNPGDQGLLGTYPEFVDLIELPELTIYRILILYNNDYAVTFFSQVGQFDDEIEEWLKGHISSDKEEITNGR